LRQLRCNFQAGVLWECLKFELPKMPDVDDVDHLYSGKVLSIQALLILGNTGIYGNA
jgi:hypothetical protein